MYSKEDKERILADFAESGLRANSFCKAPGRPSRETLRQWSLQAEAGLLDVPGREVRGRCEHAPHGRYPEATRREALSLLAKGMRPSAVARRLGVSSGSAVSSWARAAGRGKMAATEKGAAMDARRSDAAGPSRAELEERLRMAELRNEALMEMIRDPKAGDPESLSNRRKAELGERLRQESGCSLRDVLTLLGVCKSTYAYNAARSRARAEREAAVADRVRHAFEAHGRVYGYRRLAASIRSGLDGREAMAVSELEVRRAMRAGGMAARRTRRGVRYSSYAGEPDGRPGNLPLNGDGTHSFHAGAPDELVVTDVTEFKCAGGAKVYLSPIVDCFDGMPAAWSISRRPDSALCDSSLLSYLGALPEGHPPVAVHTDGGCQYRARSWKRICEDNGVVRSMSRKSCCPDNARAEGFFGMLKEEFYNGRSWHSVGPEEFMLLLDGYLRWYRDGRLKAFREDGGVVYDTIAGRRRRLGYAA